MDTSTIKDLPLYTSNFGDLISSNNIYVDKTEQIYNLAHKKGYYFLRPRRFGKSLLVSTFKELFLGKKELFKNLWIMNNTDYDFKEYPVIHLDFSRIEDNGDISLKESLITKLLGIAKIHAIPLETFHIKTPGILLEAIVTHLSLLDNHKVALLIDEYDDPILLRSCNLKRFNRHGCSYAKTPFHC